MTIDEALRHPYVKKFANVNEEIVLNNIITIPMDENTKFSIKDYREMLYRNITDTKKDERKVNEEKYYQQF
jgi:mitogen-activated protein kinase 15